MRFFPLWLLFFPLLTGAQSVATQLEKAWQQFSADNQLRHATSSLYVIDAATGQVVFDRNAQVGLAPASTQKVITSVSAYEMLGRNFRFRTYFFTGQGNKIYVLGGGDPTLGSSRYEGSSPLTVFNEIVQSAARKGMKAIGDFVIVDNEAQKNIPSGWIFEDIGNYYGAAARKLNWRENQYDIFFIPGSKEGEPTRIDTVKTLYWKTLLNNCKTGKPGSGDNAYVYFVPGQGYSVIEGTVPAGVSRFSISASHPDPGISFGSDFISFAGKMKFYQGDTNEVHSIPLAYPRYNKNDTLLVHLSPMLDSVIYWFNKKSINLYGEALLRKMGEQADGAFSTEKGVSAIRKFWKGKGLDEEELNMQDGSGLSPQNRVTTHAQVQILKYARSRDWFPAFQSALPIYNGMTMKSGTISDAKGFCGYHTSKEGKTYIFSFLVNNYSGGSGSLVNKMYKVLDCLK